MKHDKSYECLRHSPMAPRALGPAAASATRVPAPAPAPTPADADVVPRTRSAGTAAEAGRAAPTLDMYCAEGGIRRRFHHFRARLPSPTASPTTSAPPIAHGTPTVTAKLVPPTDDPWEKVTEGAGAGVGVANADENAEESEDGVGEMLVSRLRSGG